MTNISLIISEPSLTIQHIIENALLHSISDIISEQIEQPWRIPQDDCRFDPLHGLLEINKWGNLQKDKVDKINEWATW